MDKLKDMASKATGSSGGSSSGSSGGSTQDNAVKKGVDMATDKVGMGDKYDKQITDQANKQIHSQQGK